MEVSEMARMGGLAAAKNMTAKQRTERARKGGIARAKKARAAKATKMGASPKKK